MAAPIERRIRRTVLAAVLATLALTMASVLVANEQLEQAILALDIEAERDFLLQLIQPGQPLGWHTATLQGYYVPSGLSDTAYLPSLFQPYTEPYAGEIQDNGTTYMLTITDVGSGRLYLAKDISIFEYQEDLLHRFLALLAAVIITLAILLARYTSKQLAAPLARLTGDIAQTAPAPAMPRIPVPSSDQELQAIARSFNRFLDELESYVHREKSMLGMASHELRTPLAVIVGALDVIEQRDQLSPDDQRALVRIRRAANEMQTNVEAILRVSRRNGCHIEPVSMERLVTEAVEALAAGPDGRIRLRVQADPIVPADAALVRILVANLVRNALQHTTGAVDILLDTDCLDIGDEGDGLPRAYHDFLIGGSNRDDTTPLPGLGLFIIGLVSEQLQWRLSLADTETGTLLRIHFKPTA